jgi:hypothetical protein
LDGAPAQWGKGVFSINGESLTFRYERGPAQWEVKYQLDSKLSAVSSR